MAELYGIDYDNLVESTNNFGVILVTSYYESNNDKRNHEIKECLIKNCDNKFIKKIYLLNDKIYDLNFLPSQEKVIQRLLDDQQTRLSFDYAINFTNAFLKDEICILANSDIYYDNTLVLLNNYNFNRKVIALARYEHSTKKLIGNSPSSQDSWIYKSPVLINIEKCNFMFGKIACDHVIASLFDENNLVVNPCYDLKSYHLHQSAYRTYTESDKVIGNFFFIKPTNINLEHIFLDSLNKFIDEDGHCIFTFINAGYFNFLHNYVINLKKIGITWKFLTICIDKDAAALCKKYNIDYVLYNIGTIQDFSRFGTPSFKETAMKKIDCISLLLKNPNIKNLIYTDTDIAVYKDFLPYLKTIKDDKDIYFQSDCGRPHAIITDSNKCTGFMYMKNNTIIKELFNNNTIYNTVVETDNLADQHYLNNKIYLMDKISIGQFSRELFPNGIFFITNKKMPHAFLLHYNYMIGSDKIKNMKLNGDWPLLVEEEYIQPETNTQPEPKPEPKPEAKPEPKPESNSESNPQTNTQPESETNIQPEPRKQFKFLNGRFRIVW